MATREQLEAALRNAHAAGDTDAARMLANELKSMNTVPSEGTVRVPRADRIRENIVPDAKRMGADLWQAATHPLQTAGALQTLGQGAVETILPLSQVGGFDYGPTEGEQAIQGMLGMLKEDYGSIPRTVRTIENKPVQSMLDIGTLGLGAANIMGRGAQLTQKAIPPSVPANMLHTSLRFPPSMPLSLQQNIVKTMLREGITPDMTGVQKADRLRKSLGNRVDELIKAADDVKIPRDEVVKYFDDLLDEYGGKTFDAQKNINIIEDIRDEFKAHMDTLKTGDYFTPSELQDFKTKMYKQINWDRAADDLAKNDAFMAGARAAKETLADIDPEVAETNARLGDILEMVGGKKNELQRASTKLQNLRGPVGMDFMNKLVAGGGLGYGLSGGNPTLGILGTGIGATAGILAHPRTRAANAFIINNLVNSQLPKMMKDATNIPLTGMLATEALLQSQE